MQAIFSWLRFCENQVFKNILNPGFGPEKICQNVRMRMDSDPKFRYPYRVCSLDSGGCGHPVNRGCQKHTILANIIKCEWIRILISSILIVYPLDSGPCECGYPGNRGCEKTHFSCQMLECEWIRSPYPKCFPPRFWPQLQRGPRDPRQW